MSEPMSADHLEMTINFEEMTTEELLIFVDKCLIPGSSRDLIRELASRIKEALLERDHLYDDNRSLHSDRDFATKMIFDLKQERDRLARQVEEMRAYIENDAASQEYEWGGGEPNPARDLLARLDREED